MLDLDELLREERKREKDEKMDLPETTSVSLIVIVLSRRTQFNNYNDQENM